MIGEHVFRFGEDILEVRRLNQSQLHIAIDSAESQVIDLAAEWRNIGALGGIEFHGEQVVAIPMDVLREVEGERRVSTTIFTEPLPIDPDCRCRHRAVEIDEDVSSTGLCRQTKLAAIDRDELI